jgi:hypothetical protein
MTSVQVYIRCHTYSHPDTQDDQRLGKHYKQYSYKYTKDDQPSCKHYKRTLIKILRMISVQVYILCLTYSHPDTQDD